MTCPVCREETDGVVYCPQHLFALENLEKAFGIWTIGFGTISPIDFLRRLESLPGTGQKTKEIARFLLENPSKWRL